MADLHEGEGVSAHWKIVRKLAEGGFGAVYCAIDGRSGDEYAIKVESRDVNSALKVEAYLLMKLRGLTSHACDFCGCGRLGATHNYVVMSLVGQSLSDLQRSRPERTFSLGTITRLAIQCIEALQDLHRIGYVHRDVKPSNFAVGKRSWDTGTVYLLDFGMARRFVADSNGTELRPARKNRLAFRGTLPYASVNVHNGCEQGRHDDLLSLMYSLAEFRLGRLPWHQLDEDQDVANMKKQILSSQLFGSLGAAYSKIFDWLCQMKFADVPEYASMIMQLHVLQMNEQLAENGSWEWE